MIYDFIDYMQSLSHNVCDLCHCFFFCNSHNKIHTHTQRYIYIYIYIEGWVQVTPDVTSSNVTPPNNFL